MFTGLVKEAGKVVRIQSRENGGARLTVRSDVVARAEVGASIAVNGCCLTVSEKLTDGGSFDLLEETLRLTNLGDLKPGLRVNLEPSLRPTDRMGGHFVTGHVDGCGSVASFAQVGGDWKLVVTAPPGVMRHIVLKGCVTVDGMSLTVAGVADDGFTIWIIPHTFTCTNLAERKAGDRINLESDLLAKYAEKLLGPVNRG
ncbi:MAG: riboflavin synthase [Verrucomicrobia bacterium]|nr:riboflavin synthase [Verrucomicrobiota bacterium]